MASPASPRPTRPGAPPAPTPPAHGSPGEVMQWFVHVLNTHATEPLRAVLTPATRDRLPTATLHGADEIVAWFGRLLTALPDLVMTIEGLLEDGEQVFVRWRLTGTHTGGELEGIAPGGRTLDLDGVDHAVVRDGRVVSNFVVFDQLQLGRQLGVMPTAGSRVDVGLRQAVNLLNRARG